MAYDADHPTGIVGEELNIVAFVMDHVEFHFNGPKLTALTDTHVQIGSQTWTFPRPGSRDALCTLIGRTVQAVSIKTDEHILLNFGEATLKAPGLHFGSSDRQSGDLSDMPGRALNGAWRPGRI